MKKFQTNTFEQTIEEKTAASNMEDSTKGSKKSENLAYSTIFQSCI